MSTIVLAPKEAGLTPVGLRLTPGMEYEEWASYGPLLGAGVGAWSWAIGDWLFYGEWEYGSRYEDAQALTGLAEQTLKDLKYVAGRFDLSRRRDDLSLSHHREVAAKPLEEQDEWLDKAAAEGWSQKELRAQIAMDAGATAILPPKSPAVDKPVEVAVLPTDAHQQLDFDLGRVGELVSRERGVALAIVDDIALDTPGTWSEPVQIRFVEKSPGLFEFESREVE